ncbi:MAG: protein adenylyltransferase SelO [Bacteroidia bacterium]
MPTKTTFTFDNSYLRLPAAFYSLVKPTALRRPVLYLFNEPLCAELGVDPGNPVQVIDSLLAEAALQSSSSFAQAYAGHQFGSFTRLGDGRAIVLGEQLNTAGERFDIQLKGSGRTPYSRGGDGKATLYAMLREYLISEAMHHLGVPSSRSMAVLQTGESVQREVPHQGAALLRVMRSHLRVGTFQYAAYLRNADELQALLQYTIERLYPELANDDNPALALFYRVMDQQITLVVNWMRVGFIHGVMNTDNTSISGETFDYGPCAFLNAYHPARVYSSIDQQGRYAFGNQPNIIKWNLARFAEALLPILHAEKDSAIALAQDALDGFDARWQGQYNRVMLQKIGFEEVQAAHLDLLHRLLKLMEQHRLDYTNTFASLCYPELYQEFIPDHADYKDWQHDWQNAITNSKGLEDARELMRQANPLYIPRNHGVEAALQAAINGNRQPFDELLQVLSQPYQAQAGREAYLQPDVASFEADYQTFCGT